MVQTGHWNENDMLDRIALVDLLKKRFAIVDFAQAAQDVEPFITDARSVELWAVSFFSEAAEKISVV
jgi:hypothetical protein